VTLPPFLRLPSLHLLLSPPPLDFISGVSSQRLSVSSEKERRFPSLQLSELVRLGPRVNQPREERRGRIMVL